MCIGALINPRPPSEQPPFVQIPWQHEKGEPHPLLDVDILHSMMPHTSRQDLARILQSTCSASKAAARSSKIGRRGGSSSITRNLALDSHFPESHLPSLPDNAAENPYYYPCSSPRHHVYDTETKHQQPTRHLFLHAAEERLEWRKVSNQADLPIRWLGCSPGCLTFLENVVTESEDERWGLSDDDI